MARRWSSCAGAALLVAVGLAGCAGAKESARSGPLFPVDRLETELRRGVSLKADVERVLGRPAGMGGAWLPTDATPAGPSHEIWFYQDARTRVTSSKGITIFDIVADIVLVFFVGEVFDGFFWFSHAGAEPPP